MAIFEAATLEEGVELAVRFKREGRYDWFRGQSRAWRPNPSLARLTKREFDKAEERINRFYHWIRKTPGLEELRGNPDAFFAVAQHYGIPTNFLDFSTDPGVAGYFASGSRKSAKPTKGCIYCLNSLELKTCWDDVRKILPHYPDIDLIKVKVSNLWRLEAQHGVFLFCPGNWDVVYKMDRILFPASGPPPFPIKSEIYPVKKSQLELLLDHYFYVERFVGFPELMMSVFPEAKVLRIEGPRDGYEASYFVDGKLSQLSDWRRSCLKDWLLIPSEKFRMTVLGEIALEVSIRQSAPSARQSVAYAVRRALELDNTLRNKAIRWVLAPQERSKKLLGQALDWLWSGLRLLPFSDEDIADGIGLCFALHRLGFAETECMEEQLPLVESLLGPSVFVEFSSWEGSCARSFASRRDLLAATRPDIRRRLRPRYRRYASDIRPLLQLCSNHRRLFRFKEFSKLFATQLSPIQVLMRGATVSHFSPARLNGFGLP